MAYVIGVFGAMMLLNVRLALLVMTVVPVIAVITALFQNRILRTNRRVRAVNSRITGAYNEGITGAKTSKTLVIEDRNDRDFQQLTGLMYRTSVHATMLNAMFIPIVFVFRVTLDRVFVTAGRLPCDGRHARIRRAVRFCLLRPRHP